MKQESGGTLLGVIIGIVVGLGVALAVAVYVTKMPVPFLNKGSSRTPEQDAAEAQKNKDWDPNAPLANKGTPRPPTAATALPKDGKLDKTAPAVKSASRTDNKASPSPDPLGDLARAKTVAATPYVYFIQVGAFRAPEDAEAQRAKLSLTGVEAKVTERDQAGRKIFRVRVGPYERKEEAEKIKSQLEAAGYETAMATGPR